MPQTCLWLEQVLEDVHIPSHTTPRKNTEDPRALRNRPIAPRARSDLEIRRTASAFRRHGGDRHDASGRSEEHTSELQSLMRISYAVFCLKKKTHNLNALKLNNTNT